MTLDFDDVQNLILFEVDLEKRKLIVALVHQITYISINNSIFNSDPHNLADFMNELFTAEFINWHQLTWL